jgi:hypothetical protein
MSEDTSVTRLIKPRFWIIVPEHAKWADTDVDLYRNEQDAIDAARAACSTAPIQPFHVMGCYPMHRVELTQKIDVIVTNESEEDESAGPTFD